MVFVTVIGALSAAIIAVVAVLAIGLTYHLVNESPHPEVTDFGFGMLMLMVGSILFFACFPFVIWGAWRFLGRRYPLKRSPAKVANGLNADKRKERR